MGKHHFANALHALAPSLGLTLLDCGQKAAALLAERAAAAPATANAGSWTPALSRKDLDADTASLVIAMNALDPAPSWHAVSRTRTSNFAERQRYRITPTDTQRGLYA